MEAFLLLLSLLGVNGQGLPCSGSFLQDNITLEVIEFLLPFAVYVAGGLVDKHQLSPHSLSRQIFLDLAGNMFVFSDCLTTDHVCVFI